MPVPPTALDAATQAELFESPLDPRGTATRPGGKPMLAGRQTDGEIVALFLFVTVPFLALLAAVPVAWGWGLGWSDVVIAGVMYLVAGLGITVGFHRYFTHGSFRSGRAVTIALAVAGSLAVEGSVIRWVADHRRHHALSDREGDPHSPWLYGDSLWGLTRGLWHAHTGWLFTREQTNPERYAPDLLKNPDVVRVSRAFPALVAASMLLPPLAGGLLTWSWQGAVTAFFWGSLVRVAVLHHVTWSVNSICHVAGKRPFESRDKSGNVWWLALPSFGESWHNLHHADPTCARHGVLTGQVDVSARVIWLLERMRLARDVRWPRAERLSARRR